MEPPLTGTPLLILTAAEALFAEHGFHAVSLRQIAARAGANLAGVNYHFFDKASLCRAILVHRLRHINEARLAELAEAEARLQPGPVPVEKILEIMARPMFLTGSDATRYNASSRRLVGRLLAEPLAFSEEVLAAELQPALTRFGQSIRRNIPSLSPEDFVWRFSLVVGTLHHAMATLHDMTGRTKGVCRSGDGAAALKSFIAVGSQAFAR